MQRVTRVVTHLTTVDHIIHINSYSKKVDYINTTRLLSRSTVHLICDHGSTYHGNATLCSTSLWSASGSFCSLRCFWCVVGSRCSTVTFLGVVTIPSSIYSTALEIPVKIYVSVDAWSNQPIKYSTQPIFLQACAVVWAVVPDRALVAAYRLLA
jgi:hypothetical protein